MGVLVATEQIPPEAFQAALFIGELSLDRTLRHIRGALSLAYLAKEQGLSKHYLPETDAAEAALIDGIDINCCANAGTFSREYFSAQCHTTF